MSKSFFYSIMLHLLLVIFAFVHFPSAKDEVAQENVLVMGIVEVAEITNLPNKKVIEQKIDEQALKQEKNTQSEKQKIIRPSRVEKAEEVSDQQAQKEKERDNVPTKKADESKLQEITDQTALPKKEEKKLPSKDVKKLENENKNAKQSVQKVASKKEKKNKQLEDEWSNSVLKSLKSYNKNKKPKSVYDEIDEIDNDIESNSSSKYDKSSSLSISQITAVSAHIRKFWSTISFSGSIGANDSMKVRIIVSLSKSGDVTKVKPIRDELFRSGDRYQVFVQSTIRAIYASSPLPKHYLPQDKYDAWKEMELTFDSSGMVQ